MTICYRILMSICSTKEGAFSVCRDRKELSILIGLNCFMIKEEFGIEDIASCLALDFG